MSLKTLKNNNSPNGTGLTFESLSQNVDQLSKLIDRAIIQSDNLKEKPDLKIFARLDRTKNEIQSKLDSYTKSLSDLRRTDPSNSLESEVADSLEKCRYKSTSLEKKIDEITVIHHQLEEDQARTREQEHQQQLSQEQMLANQMSNEVSGLENAVQDIVEDMTELNDLTHQLNNKIQEQHEIVVRVDDVIEVAVNEMQQGNEQLEKAEEHQKSSNSCLIYILIALIIIIALIVVYFLLK